MGVFKEKIYFQNWTSGLTSMTKFFTENELIKKMQLDVGSGPTL